MTDGEEKIYQEIMKLRTEMATANANFTALKTIVEDHDTHIETAKADRNKIIGISWIGGGIAAIGGFIYEMFFRHS
jgi:hypothetical protein